MTVFIVVVIMKVDFFRKYMTFNLAHHPKTYHFQNKRNKQRRTHTLTHATYISIVQFVVSGKYNSFVLSSVCRVDQSLP